MCPRRSRLGSRDQGCRGICLSICSTLALRAKPDALDRQLYRLWALSDSDLSLIILIRHYRSDTVRHEPRLHIRGVKDGRAAGPVTRRICADKSPAHPPQSLRPSLNEIVLTLGGTVPISFAS